MKARDVVGRTITSIQQDRVWDDTTNTWRYSLNAIRLDNGKAIILLPGENGYDYYIEASVS